MKAIQDICKKQTKQVGGRCEACRFDAAKSRGVQGVSITYEDVQINCYVYDCVTQCACSPAITVWNGGILADGRGSEMSVFNVSFSYGILQKKKKLPSINMLLPNIVIFVVCQFCFVNTHGGAMIIEDRWLFPFFYLWSCILIYLCCYLLCCLNCFCLMFYVSKYGYMGFHFSNT